MKKIFISDGFDNLHYHEFVFLKKAADMGEVTALLWSDAVYKKMTGTAPKYSEAERSYFAEAVRYISKVEMVTETKSPESLPVAIGRDDIWLIREDALTSARMSWAKKNGVNCVCIQQQDLNVKFPLPVDLRPAKPGAKKVVVTGCYDWLHSGHVRFFEETSEYGALYVIVGCDKAIKLLKGDSKPMFPEWQRFFMVDAMRYVTQGLVSSGIGWMDAENEIMRIKPDYYIVNEDGDRPEKAEFCTKNGIEYKVLKRLPKEGLPKRTSTDLRGF